MKVELVAKTVPVQEGLTSGEDLVSYCARVSNPSNQLNTTTAGGLLRYCIKHKHFSVFETVNLVMSIKTTRDIGRQILRHRSFSYQEFSQRYAETSPDMVVRETRLQDNVNKQNSIVSEDTLLNNHFYNMQEEVFSTSRQYYEEAISLGVAKEQARSLLPEGLTETHMYMNGTLRSWLHFCMVRCGIETQKECRLIAKECTKIIIKEYPVLEEILSPLLESDYSAET